MITALNAIRPHAPPAPSRESGFVLWHETVMPVLSPQVRYEDINGPSSVAVRGQSLTQLRHSEGQDRYAFLTLTFAISQPEWSYPIISGRKRHEFFFEDYEREIHTEHYPVVVCYLCFGRTEGRRSGGGLDVGGCAWRRRTRQGIAALFR